MTCIYTGAVVHIVEYDVTVVCDLHQIGTAVIIRMPHGIYDSITDRPETHFARVNPDLFKLDAVYIIPEDQLWKTQP